MKILAIDTTSKVLSVALLEDNNLICEHICEQELKHSINILPSIDMVVKKAGIEIGDVDLFAVSIGPGSFTGIRIGIATVKGLCASTGKKVVGVSSLKTLAMSVMEGQYVCPMIQSLQGEMFYAVYKRDKMKLQTIIKECADLEQDAIENAKAVSEDMVIINELPSAVYAGIYAFYNQDQAQNEKDLLPLYIKRSSAQKNAKG